MRYLYTKNNQKVFRNSDSKMFIIILIDDIAVSILYASPEPNTFPKVNEVDKVGCLWNWKMSVNLSNNDK